jgi:kinesin family protein 1
VRKKRDRATAKSNLHQSISAADLENLAAEGSPRPDSPTSSVSSSGQADVDWTFAQREAAFARLGLDPTLDNLPDDDLNKLFEKITRVKTLRDNNSKPSRPESSLSQANDDFWSEAGGRALPSEAPTDETSLQGSPWAMNDDSSSSHQQLKDAQHHLENRLHNIAERESVKSAETEDLIAEKEHMEHQLRLVRVQMRRMVEARARGDTDLVDSMVVDGFEPVIYSGRQLRLIRKVLDKWRAHRSFSMAEMVLTNAVAVKEANIIR